MSDPNVGAAALTRDDLREELDRSLAHVRDQGGLGRVGAVN